MAFNLISDSRYKDLKYFVPDNLKSDGIAAAFMTRLGGVSGKDFAPLHSLNFNFIDIDSRENVMKNYAVAAESLGFSHENIISANQRHTDDIIICDDEYLSQHSFLIKEIADGMITNIAGTLLSVKTADCVPILFYDEKNRAVGAAHCGWKGTFKELQKKIVCKMAEVYNSSPSEIKAAVGACISLCCYEVSEDFYEDFHSKFGVRIEPFFERKANAKYHCDLKGINKMLLEEAGIRSENIEISENCTCCEKELFFSHRRDGEKRGTLAAFIGIRQ